MGKKENLYKRAKGRCEFSAECKVTSIEALTIDHIMPKAMARILGWADDQINSPDNLQLLCQRHHNFKDRDTSAIVRQMRSRASQRMLVATGGTLK